MYPMEIFALTFILSHYLPVLQICRYTFFLLMEERFKNGD